MKRITIGSTTFDATKCERFRDNTKGFYLDIAVPVENISKDALYDLLNGNEETIYVAEEDGTESIYDGFNSIQNFSVSKGCILVAQYCTSELEAQLSLAKSKIAAQDKAIEDKSVQIASLEEMSMAQLSTIDSILTEVVPTIIELSVTQAIEAVLTTQEETAGEEPEVIEE